jgi:uncharacterized protein YbbC (DUF1343 family)
MLSGLDRLLADDIALARLRTERVGLLAHPASVDAALVHAAARLRERGVRIAAAFGPEHGYGGEAQDMIGVAAATDAHGTPVYSLYGDREEDLVPTDAQLAGLDVLLVDLQDVGARYYTFVWTAVLAARACAKRGVRVVVLDRPNPIGGLARTLEGACPVDRRYLSFVGLEPVPVRHALTLGELVAWRADVEGLPREAVEVVPAAWDRARGAEAWGRAFVPPSPNMPTADTALVYPGGCLIEGTNLSEGRGTTRPFELVGAPFLDGEALAKGLEATGLPGFRARPVIFQPTFHKHAGKPCGGVFVHATDPTTFRPYATYVALIALAARLAPEHFRFRTERYEFRDDVPALDLLCGGPEVRERISVGDEPRAIAEDAARVGEAERALHEAAVTALLRRAA